MDAFRTQRRIFDWLKRLDRTKVERNLGVVTVADPLTVTIADQAHTDLKRLDSYNPTAGDVVYVARTGADLLVLGSIESGNPQTTSAYTEMTTTRTTTSAALEDITGTDTAITLYRPAILAVWMNCHVGSDGICDLGLAIRIQSTDHDEVRVHMNGSTDDGTAAVVHRGDSVLPVGTYTIKGRFRRISGSPKIPEVNRADVLVVAL